MFSKNINANKLIPEELHQLARARGVRIKIVNSSKFNCFELRTIMLSSDDDAEIFREILLEQKSSFFFDSSAKRKKQGPLFNSTFAVFIHDANDSPVGAGVFVFDHVKKNLELQHLYIVHKYQKYGLGRIIVSSGLYLSRFLNASMFKVHSSNVAEHFYRKLGFEKGEDSFYFTKQLGLFSNAFVDIIKEMKPQLTSVSEQHRSHRL